MNILVVRNDKLGDFITALPTMYVLKQHNSNNRIIACVAPLNKSLAESMPFIDKVIVDDIDSSLTLAKKMRTVKLVASITLFSNIKSGNRFVLSRNKGPYCTGNDDSTDILPYTYQTKTFTGQDGRV